MVKENNLRKCNYWIYPYLAYIFGTQICVCFKMSAIYIYKCPKKINENIFEALHENICI